MNLVTAVRSEWTKLLSTRGWWILAAVLVAYIGVSAALIALVVGGIASGALGGGGGGGGQAIPPTLAPPLIYSLASALGYVVPLLVGTLLVTGEYRHATLTPTFLAMPRRGCVLLAKVVVALVAGAGYAVLALVAAVVPGAAILAAFGLETGLGDPGVQAVVARAGLALVTWTVVGVGLGTVLRNQAIAIVLILAFTQFVEPLLRAGGAFVEGLSSVTRLLPGAAGDALVGASIFSVLSAGGQSGLEWWQGGLVLAAYAVVFLVLGWLVSWRRDVT